MAEEQRDHSRIAYHLAKSASAYLTAVVAIESGKTQEQRLELSDNEIYAANIMLVIAVNKISMDYQQNPSVVHLLALEDFWNGIYSDKHIKSLQNEMNNKYNGLLVNSRDIVESVGNLFSELGQHDDLKTVEELADIYHLWVKNLDITNHGIELTTASDAGTPLYQSHSVLTRVGVHCSEAMLERSLWLAFKVRLPDRNDHCCCIFTVR